LYQDANQTHLVVAGRGPQIDAHDEPAMKVLCTILGSGMSSRLFQNVREKKGLAYSIYMGMSTFVDTGKFEIYAGVNNAKILEAMEAVTEELRKIRTEGIDKRELQKAKEQVRGRMIMGLESNAAVADMMGSELIVSGRVWTLEEILHKIDQVSPEDVLKAAQSYLQPSMLRLAAIGPLQDGTIKQLEDILRRK
jgi:predicted Zn-dependent peptidase